MKFCSACGAAVALRIPDDDSRPRHVCTACGTIHYQNPNMVIGSLPEWKDKILLCRRAIEPRLGLWTLPGGFMENGESTTQAAIRETLEEANARIEIGELYSMYSLPYINQVHLLFRARLLDLDFSPGIESLEVRLFGEAEIPWDEIAFRPIRFSLEHFFAERKQGQFNLHVGELPPTAYPI
ncbi:MAG: NUDIX hydrolase [Gallionellales bacterium CG_4_10_14_3_um_filter_54_96]|nr:MAG: NUDIX hydrolase [Gallionellales bacterium CG03_land_8_20_14_0_80_55_15]PIX03539.1 MAG: NUDIX hydrolase [Gallionellales bacterium CG_4_8_14_3_um_filter_54_18]PIY05551.1 MAG: NUDIX hydrolase [Gallionellales bacterium CG_4_10_14_3_um_filter_54_96]PJC03450.1 MAG: NUDIX hydrolase [Gallionellales bacterium CG_4_9_14_0_8_um_filter_55_61]